LWIGVMLIPSIVTTGAPNFTRALGALPMVFAMPGIAVEALLFWAPRLFPLQYYQSASRVTTATIWLGLIVVLGINAASTYEDYFIKWPQHPETQFVFQADFAAIAKDIDASDVQAVAVGGLSNDTMDSSSLDLLLQRKNVWVRWFDSGSPLSSGGAILLPLGPGERVYIPSIVPVAPSLLPREDMRNVFQNDHFLKFDPIDLPLLVSDARYFFRAAAFLPEGTRLPQRVTAGSNLQFISQWAELWPATAPRRIFVHLVDPATGKPIAQHDGLDSPPRFWRYGDRLFQLHRLLIPESTPPGKYELWLGLYDPTTNARISQTDRPATEPASDHVVLGAVEVTR
jgi:hypothetical protein